jgi:predicted TIM-barrel fold metal-dependent hydrolase
MLPVEYFKRQCFISADQDGPGIKHVIEYLGDDNLVTAPDFGHPEGRHYQVAVQEILKLPDVPLESKKKMMWNNALRLYPIRP